MCINLIYRLYGIYYEQHILYKIGTYLVQSTTLFESNRIKLSPSSSFQRMNALARVRSRLFSSPYLVNLRDITSANSTPTIDFPLEVQSRETGFSRDYTFRRLARFSSWVGEIHIDAIQKSPLRSLAVDVRLSRPRMFGVNAKQRAGVDIRSLRR